MDSMLNSVTHELTQLLLAALLAGLTALIGVLFQKFNLEKVGLKREALTTAMRSLVLSFEEQVEASVKKGLLPAAGKGAVKMELVLAAFMEKHPHITKDEATLLAHEAVATVGVGSADFLAKLLQATRKVEVQ